MNPIFDNTNIVKMINLPAVNHQCSEIIQIPYREEERNKI